MSTHGEMVLREDGREIILYTWHDGHTTSALELLLELPFLMFEWSKNKHDTFVKENKHIQGPWFYGMFQRQVSNDRVLTKGDVYESFDCGLLCDLQINSMSNWIVFSKFDTWTVVPDESWTAYPGKDIIVDIGYYGCDDLDGGEYKITVPDLETWGYCQEVISKTIPNLNSKIKESFIKVQDNTVIVPFLEIVKELTWMDIKSNLRDS